MSKRLFLIPVLLSLAACNNQSPVVKVDQELRQKLFLTCLEKLPAGPKATHYNDWSEVVNSCSSVAYYQSKYCESRCETSGLPERIKNE